MDRIGLDLERIGKRERQPGTQLWLSDHEESRLPAIAAALRRANLFVRCNPPHAASNVEIERLLVAGAEVIMLPAFVCADDVRRALDAIAGRARLVPLVALPQAIGELEKLVA